jgi:formyl-CoA transferase
MAPRGGVMVSMTRMTTVLEIDLPNRTATVQPGLINLWLSNAVRERGYFFAPDPSSQMVSSIGGNVSTNAGGPHCLKYGITTNHVLGLEFVTGTGEVIRVGGKAADRPGYDLIVQGESGVMDLTGFPDGPPVKVGNSIADLASGTMAAHGVALALLARERTGAGQKVEISMLEVMAALLTYQGQAYLTTGANPRRRGNQHPSIVPYEVFEAQDAYLTVGVANNSLWTRFCQAIGHPEVATDARFDTDAKRVEHRDALVPLLAAIFRTAPAATWLQRLERAGVPAGKIKSVGEALESEHLRARGAIVTVNHPTAGPMRMVGPPIRLSGTPAEAAAPPPLLGEHTDEVLTKLLGYSSEAVAQLRADGVV